MSKKIHIENECKGLEGENRTGQCFTPKTWLSPECEKKSKSVVCSTRFRSMYTFCMSAWEWSQFETKPLNCSFKDQSFLLVQNQAQVSYYRQVLPAKQSKTFMLKLSWRLSVSCSRTLQQDGCLLTCAWTSVIDWKDTVTYSCLFSHAPVVFTEIQQEDCVS